jgi:hypothetical protein
MEEMAHQDLKERETVDHAGLAALVQRIEARQRRQVELWRRPLQATAACADMLAAEDPDS